MKVDPSTRLGSALLTLAGHLARWLVLVLGATWRVRVSDEHDVLADLLRHRRPVILSYWHDRVFLSAHFLYRRLHRGGLAITLLASQSRDGEMVARLVRAWGIDTVRRSASRGGLAAMRAIHRAIRSRGSSPVVVPDGPRGPQYHFKVGAVVLAQTSGAPILPLGFAAARAWHLRSWDRIVVPKPFSRVAVVIGEPVSVPRQLDVDAQEGMRRRLQDELDAVTAAAERAVGGELRRHEASADA